MPWCRYRAQIGVVDQDPRLFAESISANICYNCPGSASQVASCRLPASRLWGCEAAPGSCGWDAARAVCIM